MEAVGIDLGTTFSAVAHMVGDHPEILKNALGNPTTPSIVAFSGDTMKVGKEAENLMNLSNYEIVYDSKRLIGRKFDDEEVQQDMKNWPFKVIHNEKNVPMIQLEDGKTFYPEEISAIILKHLMMSANSDRMDNPITKAVITVPAYFNNEQREATKSAAKIAGIKCLQIINEPTAAAIAYGMTRCEPMRTFLVFDLGGGTFDVSILRKNKLKFEVLATHGDTHLGGADFDQILMEIVMKECEKKGIEVTDHILRLIKTSCIKAKITLSTLNRTTVEVLGTDLKVKITRAMFESVADDLFERCIDAVKICLKQASCTKKHIDDIILVGGSSAIPKVRTIVTNFFGKDPLEGINKDEAVAMGAAIYANQLIREETEKPKLVKKPSKIFGFFSSKKGSKAEEQSEEGGIVFEDVVPQALGIELSNDGVMEVVKRGSKVGRKYTGRTGNLTDYYIKNGLRITVLEGEEKSAKKNNVLDSYTITGISPENTGHPLTIVFDIGADGTLKVSAQLFNGKESGTTIKNEKFMLSDEQMKDRQQRLDNMMTATDKEQATEKMLDDLLEEAVSLRKRIMNEKKENLKEARSICCELQIWIDDNEDADPAEIRKKRASVISKLQGLL